MDTSSFDEAIRVSVLPMHGSGRELGTRLVQRIKKDLGLK